MAAQKEFELRCTSCNKNVFSEEKFTQFKCPSCGKGSIIRCERCRKISNVYVCPECSFEGP